MSQADVFKEKGARIFTSALLQVRALVERIKDMRAGRDQAYKLHSEEKHAKEKKEKKEKNQKLRNQNERQDCELDSPTGERHGRAHQKQ